MCMVARCCGPGAPGMALNSGRPERAKLILQDVPSVRKRRMEVTKSRRQVALVEQAQKCDPRIEIGGHHRALDFFASCQHHTAGAAIAHQDLLDGGICADHRAVAPRRRCDGFRDRAHAAAHETPQAAMAGHAAHHVVHQDVSRALRARAAVGADHAVGGQGDFELRRFEPFVE